MGLAETSDLETFSTVLTKDQVRRMRELKKGRSAAHLRVSLADVAREVVEAGLVIVSREQNSGLSASLLDDSKKESVAA